MERLGEKRILELIAEGEGEQLEFKLENERQPDLGELLVALANTRGGTILVGVSDGGEVVGVMRAAEVRNRLEAAARTARPPLSEALQVYVAAVGERRVLVAALPALTDAVYSYGGLFRHRVGAANAVLSDEALMELVLRRRGGEYDARALDVPLASIDTAAADKFLRQRQALAAIEGELTAPEMAAFPDPAALDMMVAVRALARRDEGYRPTVAGLLMFGRDPQAEIGHAVVQCARFKGDSADEFLDRLEARGTIEQQLRGVLGFVARNTAVASRIGPVEREDRPAYPPTALREALVNALMHRDYTRRAKVTVNVFDSRIEIISPGGLLPGLKADRLDGIHELRNGVLGQLMLWARLAETYGTGIRRMRSALHAAGLPEPTFEDGEVWFRAVLYGPPANQPVTVEQPPDPRLVGLKGRQQDLLRLLAREGGSINRTDYARRFGVSLPQAGRDLYELQERGLLVRSGRSKETVYSLPWPGVEDGADAE